MEKRVIHIYGSSSSGTSTMGKFISKKLGGQTSSFKVLYYLGGLLLRYTPQQPGFSGFRYRSIPTELALPAPTILAALKLEV